MFTTIKRQYNAPIPPITPNVADGLVRWHKADAIVGLSDGQAVSSWTDSSGIGSSLLPNANAPTYYANILNGLPIVRFLGSVGTEDGFVFNNSSTFAGCSILIVSRASNNTLVGNDGLVGFIGVPGAVHTDSSAGESSMTLNVGLISANNPSGWGSSWRGTNSTNVTTSFRGWNIWSYTVSDAGGGNITQLTRKNGGTIETKTAAGTINSAPFGGAIGARVNGSGATSKVFDGDIAEVLIYNRPLGTKLVGTENYLKLKYAL